MGTNYYFCCKTCGRFDEQHDHIGKQSAGHQFYANYKTLEDIKKVYYDWSNEKKAHTVITDEYMKKYTFNEFVEEIKLPIRFIEDVHPCTDSFSGWS